ncbi:MAG TPA: protein-arginine deiminase family protein [Thermoanaerobaculia bacterium]|nr:protein-arginine deiminase family protein [Thermoanaerobaculia bacterium]
MDLEKLRESLALRATGAAAPPPKPSRFQAGIGDLLLVRQKLKAHELGEFAHVENVLQGETREREHRRLNVREEIEIIEVERETEKEASSGTALKLIAAIRARHRAGLPNDEDENDYFPSSSSWTRRTNKGSAPVSHLLRGKLWLHRHQPEDLQALEPPLIYRRLAEQDAIEAAQVPGRSRTIDYWPGPEKDRLYPAGISIYELLYCERDRQSSVNDFVEKEFLEKLDRQLKEEFPNVPVLRLPVLFDTVPTLKSWAEGQRLARTVAFTPNLVNLQKKILDANKDHFKDRKLRPGWHCLTIPEGTVDLFEAYTQVLVESLGLKVHWIDSWYYHVRFGEIHCGTNVIRRPPINGGRHRRSAASSAPRK